MDFSKKNYIVIYLVILSIFLVAFIPLYTWAPLVSKPIYILRNFYLNNHLHISSQPITNQTTSSNATVMVVVKDELEEALLRTSTSDKKVIITVVNKAYVEPHNDQYPTMLDLFIEGFWVGEGTRSLMEHLLVVTVDQTAYDRCRFMRLNCFRLKTEGVDFAEEKIYMSNDFIKMMWARTLFLLNVLQKGYDFIFTDTDILWLRNPFVRLNQLNETDDLQISTDKFNGNPRADNNPINTGFYHVRSNNKTISVFSTWYERRLNSTGMKEQDVLERLIFEGVFKKLGLQVRYLDTRYFSGFCKNSEDIRAVATVHANCCRSISAKVADLTTVLKDWKAFKRARDAAKNNNSTKLVFRWSGHIACWNSWKLPPSRVH